MSSIAVLTAVGGDAQAQSAAGAEPLALEEVVVTAQRRAENLQSVSVAISAYSAEARDKIGIVTPQDIANFTPGLSYQNYPNRIFLRGVGRQTNTVGNDPGVATYYDGFYTGETGVIAQPTFFVDRVEVLRGPQGTLYGRNSIGGAVNVVSRRPEREFGGRLRTLAASYERFEVQADVSAPLTDELRLRLAASHIAQRKGYVKNFGGDDLYKGDQSYLEAQVQGEIGSDFDFWIKYAYAWQNSTAYWSHEITPYFTTGYSSGLYPNPQFGMTRPNPAVRDIHHVDMDYPGHTRLRDYQTIVAEAKWDVGLGVLKYVGGYNSFDFLVDRDADQTSRKSYDDLGPTVSTTLIEEIADDKQSYSHELTLASKDEGKSKWIIGLYYWHEDEDQPFTRYDPNNSALSQVLYDAGAAGLQPATTPNPRRAYVANQTRLALTSRALFGQIEYSLSEAWALRVGGRYSVDKKTGFESLRLVLFDPFFTGASSLELIGPNSGLSARTLSDTWEGWTGKLGIDWTPVDDTLVFATVSTGFKSGGFNLGTLSAPPFDRVKQESILAYELGLKTTLRDRLRLNAALFYYNYKDLQLVRSIQVGPTFTDGFVNAPEAHSYGFELEAELAATRNLDLLLSYSYLNAEIDDLCCLPDLSAPQPPAGTAFEQNLKGRRLVLAPDHKMTANATYTWFLSGGDLSLSGTYSWIGDQYGSMFNSPASRIPEHSNVDLRATWKVVDGGYRVTAYARNLLDEDSYNSSNVGEAASNFAVSVSPNEPRTFGVEVEFDF